MRQERIVKSTQSSPKPPPAPQDLRTPSGKKLPW